MPAKIVLQNKKEGAFMKKKIALLLTGTMVAGLFGGVMNVAADDSAEKIKITYMEWGDETRLKAAEEAFEAQYPLATIPGAVFSVWHNISGAVLANFFARTAEKKD